MFETDVFIGSGHSKSSLVLLQTLSCMATHENVFLPVMAGTWVRVSQLSVATRYGSRDGASMTRPSKKRRFAIASVSSLI